MTKTIMQEFGEIAQKANELKELLDCTMSPECKCDDCQSENVKMD